MATANFNDVDAFVSDEIDDKDFEGARRLVEDQKLCLSVEEKESLLDAIDEAEVRARHTELL